MPVCTRCNTAQQHAEFAPFCGTVCALTAMEENEESFWQSMYERVPLFGYIPAWQHHWKGDTAKAHRAFNRAHGSAAGLGVGLMTGGGATLAGAAAFAVASVGTGKAVQATLEVSDKYNGVPHAGGDEELGKSALQHGAELTVAGAAGAGSKYLGSAMGEMAESATASFNQKIYNEVAELSSSQLQKRWMSEMGSKLAGSVRYEQFSSEAMREVVARPQLQSELATVFWRKFGEQAGSAAVSGGDATCQAGGDYIFRKNNLWVCKCKNVLSTTEGRCRGCGRVQPKARTHE